MYVVVKEADHERADRFMVMGDDAPEAPLAVGGWSPALFGISEAAWQPGDRLEVVTGHLG